MSDPKRPTVRLPDAFFLHLMTVADLLEKVAKELPLASGALEHAAKVEPERKADLSLMARFVGRSGLQLSLVRADLERAQLGDFGPPTLAGQLHTLEALVALTQGQLEAVRQLQGIGRDQLRRTIVTPLGQRIEALADRLERELAQARTAVGKLVKEVEVEATSH